VTPEERLTRIEEAMLVNASLMNRLEQNMDRLEQKAEAHEDGIAELRAFQAAVLERMDRFIRGLESNGHK
jgi:hypothetical protein